MDTPEQPPPPTQKKVRIKAGNFEFEADGSIEDYRETFERFMDVVEKIGDRIATPASTPAAPPAGAVPVIAAAPASPTPSAADPQDPSIPPTAPGGPIGEDIINRLYRRDGDGISLLALPRSDDGGADSLIALLYGFQRLLNRQAVTGSALMKAARQSGINIPRVDTTMAKRQDFVLVAGSRRGRVYSLNNRGVVYAEGVLRRTLE